jgi:hydrogenase-4 component B
MGGLLRYLPWTAAFFMVGAIAICGLPPLNGFVSELLIYLGFFHGAIAYDGAAAVATALAAPALALIGGLAVACFVKVVGVVFLGAPRSQLHTPHEAGWSMRIPMLILVLVCLAIGIFPAAVAPLLQSAVVAWLPASANVPAISSLAPLGWITILAISLLVLCLLSWLWYRRRLERSTVTSSATWGCGYLAPSSRMQYSASSFAGLLVDLFAGILRLVKHKPTIQGSFPGKSHFESHVPEAVLEGIYLPLLARVYKIFLPIRRLQHGHLHLYILYTFITLVMLIVVSLL